jgi:hypothetical protein
MEEGMAMTWYRFHADHGPGHQSHSVEWKWLEWYPSDDDLKMMWEDIFASREWPVGGWEKTDPTGRDRDEMLETSRSGALHHLAALANLRPETDVVVLLADIKDTLRELYPDPSREDDPVLMTVPQNRIQRWLDVLAEITPRCQSGQDGECSWNRCPQERDGEPTKTGRHCPLDRPEEEV